MNCDRAMMFQLCDYVRLRLALAKSEGKQKFLKLPFHLSTKFRDVLSFGTRDAFWNNIKFGHRSQACSSKLNRLG